MVGEKICLQRVAQRAGLRGVRNALGSARVLWRITAQGNDIGGSWQVCCEPQGDRPGAESSVGRGVRNRGRAFISKTTSLSLMVRRCGRLRNAINVLHVTVARTLAEIKFLSPDREIGKSVQKSLVLMKNILPSSLEDFAF